MRRDDGHAADLTAVLEIEPPRADGRIAVEGEDVPAERVALVELELARDALLVDEDGLAHVPNACEVGGEIGVADEHGRSQQQPQPCRGPWPSASTRPFSSATVSAASGRPRARA